MFEILRYIFKRKKYYLFPLIIILALLSMITIFGQGTVYAPFIYTIF